MIEVRPSDRWDSSQDDRDDEEIEVEFTRNRDDASFEAEVDDGPLDIDVDTEWYLETGQ